MVWVLDNACMVLICLWSPPSLLVPGYGLTVELTGVYYGSCALL
jgi:hypothetical protein